MKNQLLRIQITFFLCATMNVHAGIFGPDTYEECLTDMVKTTKNSDFSILQSICRSKFPKLKKLAAKKDSVLTCEDSNEKSVYHISVMKEKVTVIETGKTIFETTSYSKDGLTFKGKSEDVKYKKQILVYGKVDPITGLGRITVEYLDKKVDDFVYNFICAEE